MKSSSVYKKSLRALFIVLSAGLASCGSSSPGTLAAVEDSTTRADVPNVGTDEVVQSLTSDAGRATMIDTIIEVTGGTNEQAECLLDEVGTEVFASAIAGGEGNDKVIDGFRTCGFDPNLGG